MQTICKCCNYQTKKIFFDNYVAIFECIKCKSLIIEHFKENEKDINNDYYSNKFYNQTHLEKSLLSTRKRQSLKILNIISKITRKKIQLIDYGFGKGVFLKEAFKFGYRKLIGIESSQKAIDDIEPICDKLKVEIKNNKLSFSNKKIYSNEHDTNVFAALDVIEHFPIPNLNSWLKDILTIFKYPKYLIIKTPSRRGILFNLAYLLAKYKINNTLLHQLLQVGTYPAHYFYFSKKGIINLFSSFKYKEIYEVNDLDYEISSFGSRLNAKGIQNLILSILIPFLSLLTKICYSDDSKIIFFRLD